MANGFFVANMPIRNLIAQSLSITKLLLLLFLFALI